MTPFPILRKYYRDSILPDAKSGLNVSYRRTVCTRDHDRVAGARLVRVDTRYAVIKASPNLPLKTFDTITTDMRSGG